MMETFFLNKKLKFSEKLASKFSTINNPIKLKAWTGIAMDLIKKLQQCRISLKKKLTITFCS